MPFGWVGSCDDAKGGKDRRVAIPCLQCLSAGWGVVTQTVLCRTYSGKQTASPMPFGWVGSCDRLSAGRDQSSRKEGVSNAFRLGGEL